MISMPTNSNYLDIQIAADSSHVLPQSRLDLVGNGTCAVFSAEDDVQAAADVGVDHVADYRPVPSLRDSQYLGIRTRHLRAGLRT